MVELSGLTVPDELEPDGDIEIQLTGLRPGEKLYEELLIGDNPEPTPYPRIMRAQEGFLPCQDIAQQLALLNDFLASDDVEQLSGRLLGLCAVSATRLGSEFDVRDWVVVSWSIKFRENRCCGHARAQALLGPMQRFSGTWWAYGPIYLSVDAFLFAKDELRIVRVRTNVFRRSFFAPLYWVLVLSGAALR